MPVESKKKIVAVSHATALPDTGPSEDTDLVAYERNTKKMTSMFKSQSFNHQHFHRLMKLTYQLHRLNINSSSMTVSAIKEEYPYFGNAKWVMKICVYFCTHTYKECNWKAKIYIMLLHMIVFYNIC